MSEHKYTVIVGDLKESREVEDRQRFAERIPVILETVSDRYGDRIKAPLVLTRGIDELSGVLMGPGVSYEICRDINAELTPAEFRFAIVTGEVDVGRETNDARRMDGAAFHRAGELIEQAREQNRCYMFDLGLDDAMKERLINELAHVNYMLWSKWTDHERRVAAMQQKMKSQKDVAQKMDISPQAVSKSLKRIRWKDYCQATQMLTQVLKEEDSTRSTLKG